MYRFLGRSTGNIAEVAIDGWLSGSDVETLVPKLRELVDDFGKIRILFQLEGADGVREAALANPTALDLDFENEVERVAVVAETGSESAAHRLFAPVTDGKIRVFELDEEGAAWRWLAFEDRS